MTGRESILEKIRRLYALARCTTEGEARAALAAADRLVQEYRIAQAELDPRPKFGLDPEPMHVGRASTWRVFVMGALCKRYGCHMVRDQRTGRCLAFGTADDTAIVRLLFNRVSRQVDAMTARECRGKGRLYADSFRTGIAVALIRMLQAPPGSASPALGSGTALARIDSRSAQAEAALREKFALTQWKLPERNLNETAFDAGKAAGKHLHLGDELHGAPHAALPWE